jgi:hypothetical protein
LLNAAAWLELGNTQAMIAMERLVAEVAGRENWQVIPAHDAAWDLLSEALPDDLAAFARLCGGIRTPAGLVIAQRVRHAQRAILGEEHPDDRSFHWYVIAEDDTTGTAERTVIDLHTKRLGRCYDAFWDRFAVADPVGRTRRATCRTEPPRAGAQRVPARPVGS